MSAGVKKEAFSSDKPFIGIANSYNNIIPGHIHLNDLAQEVKRVIVETQVQLVIRVNEEIRDQLVTPDHVVILAIEVIRDQ